MVELTSLSDYISEVIKTTEEHWDTEAKSQTFVNGAWEREKWE